jgi:hypothetical protein
MRVFIHASAVGPATIRPAKLAINSDITALADGDGGFAVLGHGERREGA